MVWAEQWSYKIDGVEVNDHVHYITQVPELETGSDDDVILIPVDGREPAYIRNQAKEGIYTFLIAVTDANDWATWAARRASLFAIFTPGRHTFTVQARGMASPLSTTIIVRGRSTAAKERRVAVNTVVPKPIF